MNIKTIFFTIIVMAASGYIWKQTIYSFETHTLDGVTTYSTVQIGVGEGNYSLPKPPTNATNKILQVQPDGTLGWSNLYPERMELDYSEPFLKTQEECPENTMYLPLEPNRNPHRGYCIVTRNNDWDGILPPQPIPATYIGFYCETTFDTRAFLPPTTFFWPHLWNVWSTRIPDEDVWDKFENWEKSRIENFVQAVYGEPLPLAYSNNYDCWDVYDFTLIKVENISREIEANHTSIPLIVELHSVGQHPTSKFKVLCLR